MPDYLEVFETYLRYPKGGYKKNSTSIAKKIRMIRTVLYAAIKTGFIRSAHVRIGKGRFVPHRSKSI
jgi:hypothetical protein